MNKSETIKELSTALCKFQGAVEKIRKEETNPFFKSKYASLANILDVIRKPLADNGLSFVQFPEGEHQLTTVLMHTSGEWIEGTYSMTPAKNDPQGLGSVITYQRRYALGAVLGLNIDDDDDANAASTPQKKIETVKPIPANVEIKDQDMNVPANKQFLSDTLLEKAIRRALDGEPDVFEKINANFIVTNAQVERFQAAMQKGATA